MSLSEKYRVILEQRTKIEGDLDYKNEPVIIKSVDLLTQDIESTIFFLENQCTAEEFVWISEIFEEISEKTQSCAFIDSLYKVASKYPEETKKYNIIESIKFAEEFISDYKAEGQEGLK